MAVGMKQGWMKAARGVAAALACLVAASCAGNPESLAARRAQEGQNAGPCPLMGVLYDAGRLVEVQGEERFSNVGYTGEMLGVTGLCRYVGDDPITMDLNIGMAFGRGPKAQSERHTYRYWVAVARRDVAPIAKQYFDVEVDFGREDRVSLVQRVERITIPRANADTSGVNFEILVGFELTPEQLAFNRDGKRFRVNAASATATP